NGLPGDNLWERESDQRDTLDVQLVNGFGPLAGQSYQIMSFPSRSSDFTAVNGLYLGHVQLWNAVRTATNVTLNALVDATDLAGSSITVPANGTPGDNVTVSYTVRNLRTPPALGSWVDSLY